MRKCLAPPAKTDAHRFFIVGAAMILVLCSCQPAPLSLQQETRQIEQWRAARITNLTSEHGWLTLVGLYWLQLGSNHFGRAPDNELVLDQADLPPVAGVFALSNMQVAFTATASGLITEAGKPISHVEMQPDSSDQPTILEAGSLRFNVIERAGKLGVRVRDVNHPARKAFHGLSYFPVSLEWRIKARFERYLPSKQIAIVNILGMTEMMQSPGALVFDKDGKQYRLDTILEAPDDTELFVMFTDSSNGRNTYGAGRFLYLPKPTGSEAWLDFNQAYSPPCAFTEFATCPLPPRQNRLALNVTAGEKKYVIQ